KLAVELAWEHGRKVAFIGRSMTSSAEIAEDLGYIEIPEGLLIHPGEMKNFAPEKVCVLISGTQGDPMSALSRAAVDNHKHAEIAQSMHGSVGNVMLIESGDVLEFDELGARKAGRVNVGRVCIDSGSSTDVVEDLVIKDRRHLSEDGIVLPIIAINKLSGRV